MNGIIIINKEKCYTSNDVVQIVKKTFKEKVGHTGTLDPMATGVLPILIGKGTQCSKYLINHDKIYTATIQLGIKTDTADGEGKVIEKKEIDLKKMEEDNIEKALKSFVGKQKQIPPIYSAIKVKGKKLYEYARNNEKVEIKSRDIEIYNIKLIDIKKEKKEIVFKVSCSKGTYIRTLCENISEKIGTIGYMKELNREKVGEFELKDAITLQQLKDNFTNEEFMKEKFLSFERIFDKYENITLNEKEMNLFLNGVKLEREQKDGIYKVYNINNKFIGTATIKENILKRDIII